METQSFTRPGFGRWLGRAEQMPDDISDWDDANDECLAGKVYDRAGLWAQITMTKLEKRMIDIMDGIADKPNWEVKVFDSDIRGRWRTEFQEVYAEMDEEECEPRSSKPGTPDSDGRDPNFNDWSHIVGPLISDEIFDFCMAEMEHRARRFRETGYYPVLGTQSADIVKSDTIISEKFRDLLVELVGELEHGPIDWHPGQENCVRDLVHPSLYPLQYGQSTVVPEGIPLATALSYTGHGERTKVPTAIRGFSTEFQWLPADMHFHNGKLKFTSYINNLPYPQHRALYDALAELVNSSLPMWEAGMASKMTLVDRRVHLNSEDSAWASPTESPPATPPERYWSEWGDLVTKDDPNWQEGWKDAWEAYHKEALWGKLAKFDEWVAKLPPEKQIDLHKYDTLQVIVKIASIHLTPENPQYSGGSWHVEGLANEHICATAIYYYDTDNITESDLSFRCGASMADDGQYSYPQNEYNGMNRAYEANLQQGGSAIQNLTTVNTPQGRLLTFPNVFQHIVSAFRLADDTRPGHRKMIILWLVNPEIPILSTANVPPQQKEPYERFVSSTMRWRLPPEISDMIAREAGADLLSESEAKEARIRLMEERSVPATEFNEIRLRYNFCEH